MEKLCFEVRTKKPVYVLFVMDLCKITIQPFCSGGFLVSKLQHIE